MLPPLLSVDHVAVTIQLLLRQGNIFLTSYQYPFYDCRKAMSLEENLPCISCVSNRWTCQWDLRYHECREASPNPEDGIIRAHMEDSCPQFLDPSPLVIPVNHETDVTFQGKNLDTVKVRKQGAAAGGDLLKFEEPVRMQESGNFIFRTPKVQPQGRPAQLLDPRAPYGVGVTSRSLSHDANETLPLHLYVKSYSKNIDSKLHVTLYNCSFGRSDCSLCRAAHPTYKCAWCGGQSRCVYEALCNATSECPPPVITRIQPETGPLGGGIRVTILGSNLGVRAEDIQRISVAGRNCTFQPEGYSVSTRIVCVIEAAEAPLTGGVEVDVLGKLGRSPPDVQFTFQQPQPLSVEPQEGPQAGGTMLTIHGTHLDTGSQEDVRVTLSGVPCKVWVSPPAAVWLTLALGMEGGTYRDLRGGGDGEASLVGLGLVPGEGVDADQHPSSPRTKFGAQLQCVTGPQATRGQMPLEVSYGGSPVPSPGIIFTYRENPVLRAFEPLRSFARNQTGTPQALCSPGPACPPAHLQHNLVLSTAHRVCPFAHPDPHVHLEALHGLSQGGGGRSINVTGQGFSLIQRFAMVVIAEPLQSWQPPREAESLQSMTVSPGAGWGSALALANGDAPGKGGACTRGLMAGTCLQVVGMDYVLHNDTKVVFLSPAVPEEPEAYNLTVLIEMDGHRALLRTEAGAFEYVPDPTFENFTGGVKKQVNKLIHARGTNLNKAMTLQEAEAFVGAERCTMKTLTETDLYCEPPEVQPPPKRRQKRDTTHNLPEFIVKFGSREWVLGRVEYDTRVSDVPLSLILPLVIVPMVVVIAVSVYCYWRKSQQAEREYEKIKSQLEGLEESVRDRCKKEFTDLMIEMEDQTNDVHEAGIPVLDYKTYTDRVFFLPSKDGDKDVMITGKLDIPEPRRQVVEQALYQFSNLLNSKSFLINVSREAAGQRAGGRVHRHRAGSDRRPPQFIHTLENQREFSARAKVYFASLLTVALHGKLEYYTDIMRTLFLELLEQYVVAKNPKLMLRRCTRVGPQAGGCRGSGAGGGWRGGLWGTQEPAGASQHR
ncbi:Plexin-B2 [Saguinus oedipus]|uniref:Plexin-B2 n=1 Tax=Saguinus oedipus TaxID=9490 RepID=A0ABQ9WJU8_SAGOE|nr:Plexin-B2 [Saguinus oedipus]